MTAAHLVEADTTKRTRMVAVGIIRKRVMSIAFENTPGRVTVKAVTLPSRV